jgi:hypothetical protein
MYLRHSGRSLNIDVVVRECMMGLFSQKLLKWKEPKAVRTAIYKMEARTLPLWVNPGIVAFNMALIMLLWWLAKHNPHKTPPTLPIALVIAFAGGCFFAYGLPWVYRICPPSCIWMSSSGIMRTRGNRLVGWDFKNIDRCEITSMETEEGPKSVLIVHTCKGEQITIGVDPEVIPRLTETLVSLNVKVVKA